MTSIARVSGSSRPPNLTVGFVESHHHSISDCVPTRLVEGFQQLGYRFLVEAACGITVNALHLRSAKLVAEASLLISFPDDPSHSAWDVSSLLVFNLAVQQHKPIFVVTSDPLFETDQTYVFPESLFGAVDGFWAIPRGTGVSKVFADDAR